MNYRSNVLTNVRDEPTNRSLWVLTIQRKIPEFSVKCQTEQSFSGKTEVLGTEFTIYRFCRFQALFSPGIESRGKTRPGNQALKMEHFNGECNVVGLVGILGESLTIIQPSPQLTNGKHF